MKNFLVRMRFANCSWLSSRVLGSLLCVTGIKLRPSARMSSMFWLMGWLDKLKILLLLIFMACRSVYVCVQVEYLRLHVCWVVLVTCRHGSVLCVLCVLLRGVSCAVRMLGSTMYLSCISSPVGLTSCLLFLYVSLYLVCWWLLIVELYVFFVCVSVFKCTNAL